MFLFIHLDQNIFTRSIRNRGDKQPRHYLSFWCHNITHNNIWQNDNSQNSTQQNEYITVKCYSDDSYSAEFHFNECLSVPKSYQIALYRTILDKKA